MGSNALLLSERKFEGKEARGSPGKTRTDNILQWRQKNNCHEVILTEDRQILRHISILDV